MTTDAYLSAARSVAELLHRPEVAAVWDKPSALTDFTVCGLAGHLAKQVFNVTRVLGADDPSSTPIVRRHGQAEVLRALSRAERAPLTIAAF
jgi:hypothetical protein